MNNAIFSPDTVIGVSSNVPLANWMVATGGQIVGESPTLQATKIKLRMRGRKLQSLAMSPRRGKQCGGGPLSIGRELTELCGFAKPNVRQLSCE
jgi:hypothetical protein